MNANNRPEYPHTDGHTNIMHVRPAWQLKHHFPASFESSSNLDKFNRKTKMLMEKIVSLHLPRLHLSRPLLFPPVLLSWLADGLATVRILNERPFSIQPVSQSPREGGFGWGEQPGFRL